MAHAYLTSMIRNLFLFSTALTNLCLPRPKFQVFMCSTPYAEQPDIKSTNKVFLATSTLRMATPLPSCSKSKVFLRVSFKTWSWSGAPSRRLVVLLDQLTLKAPRTWCCIIVLQTLATHGQQVRAKLLSILTSHRIQSNARHLARSTLPLMIRCALSHDYIFWTSTIETTLTLLSLLFNRRKRRRFWTYGWRGIRFRPKFWRS